MSSEHAASRRGHDVLDDPALNRGTAFTEAERRAHGLLPPAVETIERQLERVLDHLDAKPSDLARYLYLVGLCDRNETLFYKTLISDPASCRSSTTRPLPTPASLVSQMRFGCGGRI